MPYCCVPFCKSRTEKNIRLFSVPQGDRNKDRRHQWMKLIQREILPMSACVCEFHFTEDQFENNRLDEKRPLKCTAVPTLFAWKKDNTEIEEEAEDQNELQSKRNDEERNRRIKKGNLVKCRTCLLDTNKEKCSSVKKLLYGKTIKQMIITCVPQMSSTIAEHNYICSKCLKLLMKCNRFIESCLDVEARIRDERVIFEPDETDENTGDNEKRKHASNDLEDDKFENISVKDENCEEKPTSNHKQDSKTEENATGCKKINEAKKLCKTRKTRKSKDAIKSEDFQKEDKKQATLEVEGKRRRKKREIENSAAEDEIEAYLDEIEAYSADEKDISTTAEKVKNFTRRRSRGEKCGKAQKIEDTSKVIVVVEKNGDRNSNVTAVTMFEEPNETAPKRKKKHIEREKSPKMEIIEKTLGMAVRTYERKKNVNIDEKKELEARFLHIGEIKEHVESPARTILRTYERKKISTTPNTNEITPKDSVIVKIDSVNDVSVDHDYIVPADSEGTLLEQITLLDDDGEEISANTHTAYEDRDPPEQEHRNENEFELKCPSCLTNYGTKRGLRDHLKKVHNVREEDSIYRCRVCGEEFTNSKDMFEHKYFHGRPCDLCAEIFSSETDLDSHKEKHPQSYSCMECGDKFDADIILEQHKTMHKMMSDLKTERPKLPPRRLQCELCPMAFRFPTRLRLHTNLVHLKLKANKCNDCGKMFGSKHTLKIHHRLKHQDNKPFRCDVCGDSFKRADYLKTHSIIHDQEQQQFISSTLDGASLANEVPSEFCGIQLKKGVGSKKHPYTYAITRKYACDVCGLRFALQRTKFVHERSHNVDPDKKFVCPICWKRFSTKEESEEHSQRHVRIAKRYKCQLCSMKFSRNILLENHILEVHTFDSSQQQEVEIA